MDDFTYLYRYGQALGRTEAGWQFASRRLQKAAALAAVSAAWEMFRRDAGVGDIGPAHQTTATDMPLLLTQDARRDAVLLWLADHGAAPIAEAAGTIATMVGATHRFGTEQLDLLARARAALVEAIASVSANEPEVDEPATPPLAPLVMAIERLRGDADFLEGQGGVVHHALPRGTLNHYVAAEPGGCWALNLALLSAGVQPPLALPSVGLISRALFRADLEAGEIEVRLIETAGAACDRTYATLCRMNEHIARGHDALAHLSRNARAREAWLLVAGLGACTRTQLRRVLGLSRAGGDIQAHVLADAGLVALGAVGQISWRALSAAAPVSPAPIDQVPLANAVSDLDASMAEINRLLARIAT
ncbi:hypothetical protein [Sphingomonas sp. PAMC 26621]|uniref:hypothetical protein n=1 Tax=Sphingomonas sp. PAMC 26621 TaxID=1112213 RepID=UPI000289D5CA|nr:hypothetical protein [Sphingomonas sp. PAMC 26621]